MTVDRCDTISESRVSNCEFLPYSSQLLQAGEVPGTLPKVERLVTPGGAAIWDLLLNVIFKCARFLQDLPESKLTLLSK